MRVPAVGADFSMNDITMRTTQLMKMMKPKKTCAPRAMPMKPAKYGKWMQKPVMISTNIENFTQLNDTFGYAFGEKVLRRVGQELTDIAGNQRVIGHVYAERFVILTQGDSDEELQSLCNDIEQRISSIAIIDGMRCTVYALSGFSRFSELGDVEAMKRHNRDQRLGRRDDLEGSASNEDAITSSLL